MTIKEQIFLLELIMYDIRWNADETKNQRFGDGRVWKCLDLVHDFMLAQSVDSENPEHRILSYVDWYEFEKTISIYITCPYDGRVLRTTISQGGFLGLNLLHGMEGLQPAIWSMDLMDEIFKYCRMDIKAIKDHYRTLAK